MKQTPNRNSKDFYFCNAGRCTRCEGPFHGNKAFIVREKIAWKVLDDVAFTQIEKVPVCIDCVDVAEAAQDHATRCCPGCQLSMQIATIWQGRYCSERCQRRDRRKRLKAHRRRFCQGCGTAFRGRADAKHCSSACRQMAHRRHRSAEQVSA